MARARNIKPSFFKNEQLVELEFSARLLFIGLWTLADRDGRLEDRPKRIKMELFPADDVNVDSHLSGLEQAGFITRYKVDGEAFIAVNNFAKHQTPHIKEQASTIPAPDMPGANTVAAPPDSLIPDSLNPDCLNPKSASSLPAQVCIAMRKAGVSNVNPSDPRLLELVNAGAHVDEFVSAATKAAGKGDGFAYAMGIVKNRRREAAEIAANPGRAPPKTRAENLKSTLHALTGGLATAKDEHGAIDGEAKRIG